MQLFKHIENDLYISFKAMVDCGVPKTTILNAKQYEREGWTFIKDPSDQRKVLIKYEDLKPKYKDKVVAKFGNPYTYAAEKSIKQYLKDDYNARMYYIQYRLDSNEGIPAGSIDMYTKCAELLNLLVEITAKNGKKKLKTIAPDKKTFWEMVCSYIEKENLDLPSSYKRLLEKVSVYKILTEDKQPNYACLIKDSRLGNCNAEKINEEAADWLVAQYSMPTTLLLYLFADYNIEAKKRGWKELKHVNTIYQFLHKEEIQQQWFLGRYGEYKYKEKYGYALKTILPTLRDSLWYGDGTKLNYFYLDANKAAAKLIVYEVIDVYSECLLGYSVGLSENYELQYYAYKMAIQFAGQKPYEIRYDNQGGHKKIKDDFLSKLSKVGFNCQPYNGKSKTIESIFGRFQSQFLRRDWNFTGQNITAKKLESSANRQFITQHAKHLPNKEEVIKMYEARRNEWNNAKHPKHNCSRLELYLNSQNPKAQPVDYLEMVEMFWLSNRGKKGNGITYYTHGITLTLDKVDYEYEVLKDGNPDFEFRRKYIDAKFVIKFDPSDLSHIRLYKQTENGLQFINIAEPRIQVHRATQDHEEGEKARISSLINFRNKEVEYAETETRKRAARTGVSILNQVMPSFAEVLKQESLMTNEDEEFDVYNQL